MRTGPNWGNERFFKCSKTKDRPFLVVSKVNFVHGAVDFLLYGRVAGFTIPFVAPECLNLPLERL